MTNDSSASTLRYATPGTYQAGVCNIGPAEIQRRRMAGHVGLAAALAVLAVLAVLDAPPILRLAVTLPVAVSASGYIQARMRFCANYGWRGIFNLGEIGDDGEVVDAAARAADRRRALRIGLSSLAIGIAAGLLAVLLPV